MTIAPAAIPHSPLVITKGDACTSRSPVIDRRLDRFVRHAAVWTFLFAIAWLAHFSQSRNMGFYSDDMTFAVPPLTWHMQDVDRWIKLQMRIYPEPQGRPLGFLMGLIIPYFGNQLGGVQGMFVVGWIILSINALLFYYLLRRCFSPPIPFLGALFYLLFPADTTREFLCHAHILQPSLTFMLIAGHLYLCDFWSDSIIGQVLSVLCRVLSYAMVACCLVTYETAVLPFLAIPLLERSRDRRWRIEFAVHLAIVMAIVVTVYVTRMHGHEYRAVEASESKFKTIGEIIGGSVIGPAAIAKACIYRAFEAMRDLVYRPWQLLGFLSAMGVFVLSLWLGFRRARVNDGDARPAFNADLSRAFQFGAAALAVSYLFCFTHFPPACIEGQETSVHLAATIGACTLLAAAAGKLMLLKVRRPSIARHWFGISLCLIALYFTLIFSAALDEQNAYVILWQQKQQFWTRLFDLCPDLREGTMVICDGHLGQPVIDHKPIWFMPPNCWSDSLVLEYSYKMPTAWKIKPQVSAFPAEATHVGWRTWLERDRTGKVVWKQPPYGRHKGDELVARNTILLRVTPAGQITRIGGTVDIDGKPFRLSDPTARGPAKLAKLPLYSILTNTPLPREHK